MPAILCVQEVRFRWVAVVRSYIRHPADIPLVYSLYGQPAQVHRETLKDVSRGGLCFRLDENLVPGSRVRIRIDAVEPPFEVEGIVAWCHPRGERFEVGVRFEDSASSYSLRMVEQVCHIKQYRLDVERSQGRRLSSDQAAREWIASYARDFPALH